jgi:group I intron endonuclease
MFRIYVLRNDTNGKCYIGVTKKFFGRRIREHIWSAKRKGGEAGTLSGDLNSLGEEAFSANVLEHVKSATDASARERYLIDTTVTSHPNGYNVGLLNYWVRETATEMDALTYEARNLDDRFKEEAIRRIYVYEKGGPYKASDIGESPHQIEYELACELGLVEEYFGNATSISINLTDALNNHLQKRQE